MASLLAIVSFAIAVLFYALRLGHGTWTWTLFALIGLLCLAVAGRWDGWPHGRA